MGLARFRGHVPLVVFIFLPLVCLPLIGFACACLTDHPGQAIDRAISLGGELPPVIVVWTFMALAVPSVFLTGAVALYGRASPQLTQRFLF